MILDKLADTNADSMSIDCAIAGRGRTRGIIFKARNLYSFHYLPHVVRLVFIPVTQVVECVAQWLRMRCGDGR
jgi:hypothetical protein